MLFLLALLRGGLEVIRRLRSHGLGVLLVVKGSILEILRLKKAFTMSFFLKGVFFYNSGIVAYLALKRRTKACSTLLPLVEY